MEISSPGRETGSGLKKKAFRTISTLDTAAIPSAKVRMTVVANTGESATATDLGVTLAS
jgi:hypothetical protein